MRKLIKRFAAIAIVGATAFFIGLALSTRVISSTTSASANEPVVEATDDVGPPEDTLPLVSFAPTFEGSPRWSAVTYSSSGGQCFDLNAEWNGRVVGSVGACGFGEDVDSTLRLLSVDPVTIDAETLISKANVATPFVLAEGYVASPNEAQHYGVVAGIVDCDCLVKALWADGAVGSANVVNGLFLIQRNPVVVRATDAAEGAYAVASVVLSRDDELWTLAP